MMNTSDPPKKTFLAAYKEEHGSSAVWLASQLKTSRYHVSHLVDPSNKNYARYPISEDLFRRVSRFLHRRSSEVIQNYHAVKAAAEVPRSAAA